MKNGNDVKLSVVVDALPSLGVHEALRLHPRAIFGISEVMGTPHIRLSWNGKPVAEAQFVNVGDEGVGVQITSVRPVKEWAPKNVLGDEAEEQEVSAAEKITG